MFRNCFVFLFVFFFCKACIANIDTVYGKIGVSVDYYFGKHIKHNPKIIPDLNGFTHAYELSVFKQTTGEKSWMRKLKHPELGGAIHITQNVNPAVLGVAIGGMGTAKFWMFRSKKADLFVRLGSGVAFFTKYFNAETNRDNNVIGSSLNVIAQIKIGADFKPKPWLHLSLAAAITHQSNGALRPPNLGINVVSAAIGLRYFPMHQAQLLQKGNIPKVIRPNEVMVRYGLGWMQAWFEGPMMPVHFATIAYARYTSIINKVYGGFTCEYSTAKQYFWANQGFATEHQRKTYPVNLSFFVGDEFYINRIGILGAVGVYLYHPEPTKEYIYFRAGFNYYPYDFGKDKTIKPFVGAHLKTHQAIAQTIEFVAGICFR